MFKVTGVSKYKGKMKVRFANDMMRVKGLAKYGQTDIDFIELPIQWCQDCQGQRRQR